jgi:hypothetical protein
MTTKIKLANNVADVDLTTTAPTNGQGLIYNSTSSKWVPGAAGGGATVYDTIDDLPLSGVNTGVLALVDSTNKLYLWMDTGWYNIATINTNPSITGGNETPYILATDGTPTEITLIASDPEGIPLTWSYEVTSGSLTNGGGTTATVSNVDNVFTVTPTTTEAYAGEFSLTFKASDGVNLGTTVAAFTLAFSIQDSKYTTLLAKGVAATQNATFVDSSTNAHTITANGDVYQGTFSPYRAGGYSMYFDGTGDYLNLNSTASIGTGDFTIETWVFITTPANTSIIDYRSTGSLSNLLISINIDTVKIFYNGSYVITATDTIPPNTWAHVSMCRYSGIVTLYINGVSQSETWTNSSGFTASANRPRIGASGYNDTSLFFGGNLSNFRIVDGTAVYTSNFTPPTAPLEAITNTSLLINTPYIADSSSNGHAITVNGNTSTQPFSPFNYKVYDEAINGGSAYFDGDGDYLLATPSLSTYTNANDPFTIETWVYVAEAATEFTALIAINDATSYTNVFEAALSSDGTQLQLVIDNTNYYFSSITPATWTHLAYVFDGSSIKVYKNGELVYTTAYSSFNYSFSNCVLSIGQEYDAGALPGNYYKGHACDVRMVKSASVYTSDFTPPTSPLTAITNTSLLLNFTNAGIQDYSQVSDLKLVGNATGSSTQTKYASYSMYFDGTGDYADCLSPIVPPEYPFTVEMWIFVTSGQTMANKFFVSQQTSLGYGFGIGLIGDGRLAVGIDSSAAGQNILATNSMTAGTWYHIAFSIESDGTGRLFIDGTVVGTNTFTNSPDQSVNTQIGRRQSTPDRYMNGYIEDLRITKGLARYTANFTPPTSELLG